jgi:arabinose-5-phosphate isomerase
MMMEKIGFTAGDYAKRHHGGYLGTKSREKSGIQDLNGEGNNKR